MNDDMELLRRFAEDGSETAFAELVKQRLDFVYGVALRVVDDTHLAQDIAQGVFIDLARKAGTLKSLPVLLGWLHTSTRFAAAKAVRSRMRRQQHQQEAQAMQEITSAGHEPDWEQIRPVLDEAMGRLGDDDRTALLLRFFDGRPLAEIGTRFGLAENAARMRVERALDKLRVQLARRGITSTAAALGTILTMHPAAAAPAGLAATIANVSLAGIASAATGSALGALVEFMSITKNAAGIAALITLLGLGLHFATRQRMGQQFEAREIQANQVLATLRRENLQLRQRVLPAPVQQPIPKMATEPLPIQPLERVRASVELLASGKLGPAQWQLGPIGNRTVQEGIDDLGAFLWLDETATAALARASEAVQKEIVAVAMAASSIEQGPDSVTITIKPTDVSAVTEHYLEAVAIILGPERSELWQQLGIPAGLKKALTELARSGTLTVSRRLEGAGPGTMVYTYAWRGSGSTRNGTGDRESIRSTLGAWAGVLPTAW